jgi:DUF1009 family protein
VSLPPSLRPPAPAANSTLGIVAGGGVMPLRVADAARRAGRPVFAALIDGFAEPRDWAAFPHAVVRLGAVGHLFTVLRHAGVRELVMAGRVKRPSILSLRLDAEGARLVARVGRKALFGGDDALLTAVVTVLREQGFTPIGAQHVFEQLLMEEGVPTRARPDDAAMADIRRGIAVCRQLGIADTGQGCVVQQGLVLAVEAIEGTDAMVARSGSQSREGPGGVLVKLVKPTQSALADLPVIGPDTIRAVAEAGLRGIAVEARRDGHYGTIVIDREATIAAADAAGLFLAALNADKALNEEGYLP